MIYKIDFIHDILRFFRSNETSKITLTDLNSEFNMDMFPKPYNEIDTKSEDQKKLAFNINLLIEYGFISVNNLSEFDFLEEFASKKDDKSPTDKFIMNITHLGHILYEEIKRESYNFESEFMISIQNIVIKYKSSKK